MMVPLEVFRPRWLLAAKPARGSDDQGAHCRPWTPASLSLCSVFVRPVG